MNPINTDRLRDLLPEVVVADDHTGILIEREPTPSFGKKKRPRPRPHPPPPPPPPPPTGPLRALLLDDHTNLGRYTVPGVTDWIVIPPSGAQSIWKPITEAQVKAEAAKIKAAIGGRPFYLFQWAYGEDWRTQNPWAASEAVWQAVLQRVRWWKAEGATLFFDTEDEGSLAIPPTSFPWFPVSGNLAARGKQLGEAAGGGLIIYVVYYAVLNNQPRGKPVVSQPGWADMVNGIGRSDTLIAVADTYSGPANRAAITETRARVFGSGRLQLRPRPKLLPGVYAKPGNEAGYGMVPWCRLEGGVVWFYQDPGYLAADAAGRARFGQALR